MKVDAVCKMCRREGRKLFLKGDRCYSQKCPMIKKKYPPGIHGPKGYKRLSEYGSQLRQKQQLKRFYGVSEKQLATYFAKAKKKIGDTEQLLLIFLEKRLDNLIYRAGFAASRRQARQIVSHGNIFVNDKRINIPSYRVKIGDVIAPKKKKRIENAIQERLLQKKNEESKLPSWFVLDGKKIIIKISTNPISEDLPKDFDIRSIVEFYSR